MPTTADTPAQPRARFAPLVLLTALAVALGGLALADGVRAEGAPASPQLLARELREGPSPVMQLSQPAASAVVATRSAAVRRPAPRAARKRVVVRWVSPVAAGVVSEFGPRWGRMHEGIDFGAGYGARVRAVGDGVVLGAGYLPSESGYGKIILIQHRGGAVTAYAHLSRTLVRSGERVRAGEVIGRVGNTGHSFGAHLHFEVRIGGTHVSPRRWLRRHGVYV